MFQYTFAFAKQVFRLDPTAAICIDLHVACEIIVKTVASWEEGSDEDAGDSGEDFGVGSMVGEDEKGVLRCATGTRDANFGMVEAWGVEPNLHNVLSDDGVI